MVTTLRWIDIYRLLAVPTVRWIDIYRLLAVLTLRWIDIYRLLAVPLPSDLPKIFISSS